MARSRQRDASPAQRTHARCHACLPCVQVNLFGAIYRFDVCKTPGVFVNVFATTIGATECAKFMHRIMGLTWGPKLSGQHQQLLYATGYTASAGNLTAMPQTPPPVNNVVRTHTPGRHGSFFAQALPALTQSKQLLCAAVQQQADTSSCQVVW